MPQEVGLPGEAFTALKAGEGKLPRVGELMSLQVGLLGKASAALGAFEWPVADVGGLVDIKVSPAQEALPTNEARERPIACVDLLVAAKGGLGREAFAAFGTGKHLTASNSGLVECGVCLTERGFLGIRGTSYSVGIVTPRMDFPSVRFAARVFGVIGIWRSICPAKSRVGGDGVFRSIVLCEATIFHFTIWR